MKIAVFIVLSMILSSISLNAQHEKGTFTDRRDGKVYKWVEIGDQIWMGENLSYYISKGCWAYHNINSNVKIYGYLYDYETAIKACPTGWHLPSDIEWTALSDYLGGELAAGGKLKEGGTTHWLAPNYVDVNRSGFNALPGGWLLYDGSFQELGVMGFWWSSTLANNGLVTISVAQTRTMINNQSKLHKLAASTDGSFGHSVRCIKDQ